MNFLLLFLSMGTVEWTETTFLDFRDGSVDPMCYISYRANYESVEGCVEFYARWDADNNGYYDLFVAGMGSYGQKLFMGQPGATYDLAHTITFLDFQSYGGDASGGIDMADLNLDGYAEAIHSGGWNSPWACLYWGTPSGPSTANPTKLPMRYPPSPGYLNCHETVFVYDIDKDGYLDITICGGTGSPSQNYTRIFWGNSSFSYGAYIELPNGIGAQHNLEMADLDHDGWVETVIPNYGTSTLSLVNWGENRQYTIQNLNIAALGGTNLHGTSLADFNGDEWLDIVLTGYSGITKALIYWGSEDGYDVSNTTVINPGSCYGGSSSMDMNQDGLLDIIFHKDNASTGAYPRVYFNIGQPPYFKDSPHPDTCKDLGNILVDGNGGFTADFNFDGFLDIFLNSKHAGSPFQGRSPILWGPDFTSATWLDHAGFDHHGVFREAGNVYDRSFSAWYFSSIFDTYPYDFAKTIKFTYIGYEPTGSFITFSIRSGPDSIITNKWGKWSKIVNGQANPDALKDRYVQYRAEFHYTKPSYLPWLERVNIKFYPIDYLLKLYPDSLKTVAKDTFVEYPLILYYKGDEDDSFYLNLRVPPFQDSWRIELWDTAHIDTIPWFIKLREIIPNGIDTPFIARIYPSPNAQPGDTNVTTIYTRTQHCSEFMDDSVLLYTVFVGPGAAETWIDQPYNLDVPGIGREGWVKFSVPAGEKARLEVYDATGRRVYNESVYGTGQIKWSDKDMPRGLYFVRLERPQGTLVEKAILTR